MSDVRGRVAGTRKDHAVALYGLSTCGWCADAREFLTEQGIEFDYIYVDLLEGEELTRAVEDLKRWNPGMVFPVTVVDGKEAVVGFRRDRLTEVLGL